MRNHVLSVLLLLFGMNVNLFSQTETWTEMNRGRKHFFKGELEEAERCYDKVLALDSTNNRARYNLADTYLAQGDAENALKNYKKVISSAKNSDKPLCAKSFHNIGVINQSAAVAAKDPQMKQRFLQEAIASYKDALRIEPNADDTRYNMVLCMKQLKKSEQQQQDDQEKDDTSENKSMQDEQKPQNDQKKEDNKDPQTEQLLNYARQKEQQAKEKMKPQPAQRVRGKNW